MTSHKYRKITPKLRKFAARFKTDKCKLCKKHGKTVLDHCHETGDFRGWLCSHCNLALGHVYDNVKTLKRMIKYLNEPTFHDMYRVKRMLMKNAKKNGGVIFRV